MQQTSSGIAMWSVWQPDRNLFFNSFFVQAPGGNLGIDPLPLSDADAAEIERLGGLAFVVVTNRDHERDARSLAARFGAKLAASEGDAPLLSGPVDPLLKAGEEIAGASVVTLDGLKTPGEIALHFRERGAVVVGDALWGNPAGSLRLMPDEKLADPARAALSLRKLSALRPEHLLVGDGACIFGDAHRALWACLEARTDVYVNRINVDELSWRIDPDDGTFKADWSDLDGMIGAEKLGYRLARIPPGKSFCPLHWHTAEEEFFFVVEGVSKLRTSRGTWDLRKNDFVAFPTRASGAHRIDNHGNSDCLILMVANNNALDTCVYPDSRKVLVEQLDLMLRDHPALEYLDGE